MEGFIVDEPVYGLTTQPSLMVFTRKLKNLLALKRRFEVVKQLLESIAEEFVDADFIEIKLVKNTLKGEYLFCLICSYAVQGRLHRLTDCVSTHDPVQQLHLQKELVEILVNLSSHSASFTNCTSLDTNCFIIQENSPNDVKLDLFYMCVKSSL